VIAQLSQPRPGSAPTQGSPASCLARRPAVGSRGIGRIRLGLTRRALERRVAPAPVRRTRDAYRYCTRGGSGSVTAVFSDRSPHSTRLIGVSRGRVRFVAVVRRALLHSPRRLLRDLSRARR
jgi:hypothetical protein